MSRRRRHPSLVPLSHDHREALGLAFRLHHPAPPGPVTAMTPASTPASRTADTLAFFEQHLRLHFRAEEEVLFPFWRRQPDADADLRALLDALLADHRRLETLRDAVAAAATDPDRDAALGAFADLLEQHVRREERELFERFPDVPPEAAERLAAGVRTVLAERAPACATPAP